MVASVLSLFASEVKRASACALAAGDGDSYPD
jgi:hypothetical protein